MNTTMFRCGCKVCTDIGADDDYVGIIYCAMHAAAPEMVEMLERFDWKCVSCGYSPKRKHKPDCDLAALLRRVRGGEQ